MAGTKRTKLKTHFAPPERADDSLIQADFEEIRSNQGIVSLLDCFPEPAMIVNDERQVVMANEKTEELIGKNVRELIGDRPGELIGCIHAWDEEAGCGTSRACRYCGAGQAISGCVAAREPRVHECRVVTGEARSLDFVVSVRPLALAGRIFSLVALRDTTDEKRRAVLERLFFHDILNSIGGLQGLLGLIDRTGDEENTELVVDASRLAQQIIYEIRSQRELAAAERGELEVRLRECAVEEIFQEVVAACSHHDVAEAKTLHIEGDSRGRVLTDSTLLVRILDNLVKNALESSRVGEVITLSFRNERAPTFSVHNPGVMTEEVRLQIFQRSFSTKGTPGRGIGTWSVKLLTQNYLEGQATFRSVEGEGTTFSVTLPAKCGVPSGI